MTLARLLIFSLNNSMNLTVPQFLPGGIPSGGNPPPPPPTEYLLDDLGNFILDDNGNKIIVTL